MRRLATIVFAAIIGGSLHLAWYVAAEGLMNRPDVGPFPSAPAANPASSQAPANIVFILIDDMGWRDVGFMGSEYYETPNIDRLAAAGMVFTNAYANGPNCAPTRASLMSGQYTPRRVKVVEHEHDGLRLRSVPQKRCDGVEQPKPRLLRRIKLR